MPILSTPASPLNLSDCSRFACATEFPQFSRDIPTERFDSSFPPRRIMPSKILPANKSSRRRLIVDRRQLLHLLRWAPHLPALPQLAFVATLKVLKYPVPKVDKPLWKSHISLSVKSYRGNPSSPRGNPSSKRGIPSTLLTTDPNPPPLSAFFPSQETTQRSIYWEDKLDTICLAGEVADRQ